MTDRLGLRSIDEERLNLLSNQPVPEAADIDTTNPGPTLSPIPKMLVEQESEGPGFFDRLGDRLGGLLPDRDQLAQAGGFLRDVGIHAGDFGAGFLGIESPSEKLAKHRELVNERESRQLKNAIEAQNLLLKTVEQANSLPPEQRDKFLESQKDLLLRAGASEEAVEASFASPQILDTPVFEIPEVQARLRSGGVNAAVEFINSKNGQETIREFNDQKNIPTVQEKLAALARETGRADLTFPEIAAMNPTLESGQKFTAGELGTLKRNQDAFTGIMETTDEAKTRGRQRVQRSEGAGVPIMDITTGNLIGKSFDGGRTVQLDSGRSRRTKATEVPAGKPTLQATGSKDELFEGGTAREVEDEIRLQGQLFATLDRAAKTFQESDFTLGGRLKRGELTIRSFLDALSPEQRAEKERIEDALQDLNILKRDFVATTGGKALTPTEIQLVLDLIPDTGDDPVKAARNLERFRELSRLAFHKANYIKARGLSKSAVPLESIPDRIQAEGEAILREIAQDPENPTEDELRRVDARLNDLFGEIP